MRKVQELAYPPGLIGWRIVRHHPYGTRDYASGSLKWVMRSRAFLFTTTSGKTHRTARGLHHGLAWARSHRRELRDRLTNEGLEMKIVRVVIVKRKGRTG